MENGDHDRALAEDRLNRALVHMEKVMQVSQSVVIKMELTFMRTFVMYIANRSSKYPNFKDLMIMIKDVGVQAKRLPVFHASASVQQAARFYRAAAQLLDQIKLLKPEVENFHLLMSLDSPASPADSSGDLSGFRRGFYRDQEFSKFVGSMQKDIVALLNTKADLDARLKNRVKLLHDELLSLTIFLKFSADRCAGHTERDDLFRHFQVIADTAAYLLYCCLADAMDESRIHTLVLEHSNLISRKIRPSAPEIRRLYVRVLNASKPKCKRVEDFYGINYNNIDEFVSFLIQINKEMIQSSSIWPMDVEDRTENIYVELRSLKYMLQSPSKDFSNYDIQYVQDMAAEVGCFLFSIYNNETDKVTVFKQMGAASVLLEKFVRYKTYHFSNVNLEARVTIPSELPIKDELGFLVSFSQSLEEMLYFNTDQIDFWRYDMDIITKDLLYLSSLLYETKSIKEDERLENIWKRVLHVGHETKYAIDTIKQKEQVKNSWGQAMLGDGGFGMDSSNIQSTPMLHYLMRFSDVIGKIKLIKAEAIEIRDDWIRDYWRFLGRRKQMDEREDYTIMSNSHLEAPQPNTKKAKEMDEIRVGELVLQHSELISRKIEPNASGIRELYIQLLNSSKPEYKLANDVNADEFLDFLIQFTSEIIQHSSSSSLAVKDHTENLYVELRLLKYILVNPSENFSTYDFRFVEGMAAEACCYLVSLCNNEKNQATTSMMEAAGSVLLEKMVNYKAEHFGNVNSVGGVITPSDLPKTDELGFLYSFSESLEDTLYLKSVRINFWKHDIEIIRKDMLLLRSFLYDLDSTIHAEQIKNIRRRIMHAAYEAELVISQLVMQKTSFLHDLLRFSKIIRKIKLIKAEVRLIQRSDDSMAEGTEEIGELDHFIPNNSNLDSPQSNMMIEDEEVVGLEKEMKYLIDLLLSNSPGTEIVSISGMAGLGKTTLAKKVFNDVTKGYHHFDKWATITVSQAYSKEDLLIKIIEQISHDETEKLGRMSFDELELLLNQSLKKKRYLIFLDDIWDISAWHTLKRSFPDSADRSRILFTTRSSDVATRVVNNCNDDGKVLHLQPLAPDMTLELLNRRVFGKGSCPPRLKEVRDRIASKCKGLPLAVVMVAGILKGGNKLSLWKDVANSFNSYLIDTCRGVLELSYKKLPNNLRPCFLYFGLFPEDKLIQSSKLIRLWVAEGLIPKTESESLEDLAEGYLEDLISKNLVTVAKRRSTGGVGACSMHDLVRTFCLDQSEKECFLHIINPESNHATGTFSHEYITGYRKRRLSVHFVKPDSIKLSTSFGPLVRSVLLFVAGMYRKFDLPSIYHGFRLLRVLDLMGYNIGDIVHCSLYTLTHLRYLAISGSFYTLHRISDLFNLETLILDTEPERFHIYDRNEAASQFYFPHTILKMKKLRHIDTFDTVFAVEGIICFSTLLVNLHNLQTVSSLRMKYEDCIGERMRKVPNALKKLKLTLMDERRDSSNIGNDSLIFDFLSHLESINLDYSGSFRRSLVDIVFPENIKKVTLSSFRLPWEKINVVAELPNLQVLKLHYCAFEGEEWIVQDGMFPQLTFLSLICLGFERWRASDDCYDGCCFPILKQLELEFCDQLCEIPYGLGSEGRLTMIKVKECNFVKESIEELVNEQKEMSNEDLVVHFMDMRRT